MLEHMLFKPTKQDLAKKLDAGATRFEREVGAVLNANTWKDRTTYYFSYGVEHFSRVLGIEACRMRDVVLTDKEFLPERTNVLSEFDMYNGDPQFALSVAMTATAFYSHPYGHETIGFREDISAYTTAKLQRFYNHFYRPNNAVLMILGDIELSFALDEIHAHFGELAPEPAVEIRPTIVEPVQEGIRRIEIVRPGTTNILAIGMKHPGFPSVGWYETMIVLKLLVDGPDSILQKKLIDTGLAAAISVSQEPTKDDNIATIFITLTKKTTAEKMEALVRKLVNELSIDFIQKHLKTIITKTISEEIFNRDSSLDIAAELTEYVAAGDWSQYFETEKILRGINTKQVQARTKALFTDNALTIGSYKSI
jgi:zinc protease